MSIMAAFQAPGEGAIQMAGFEREHNDRTFPGRIGVFAGRTEADPEISREGA
jgi:hypothetical protein